MSRAVIRGGQLNIHNLRMLRQVFFMGFMISLFIGMAGSFYFLNKEIPKHFWGQYKASLQADFYTFHPKKTLEASIINWPEPHGITKVSANRIKTHPYTKNLRSYMHDKFAEYALLGLKYTLLSFFILSGLWFLKGVRSLKSKQLRGQRIVSAFYLKWLIRLRLKASDLKIETVPLIKNSETKHLLVVGTTGAGKTNLLNELLPQISARQNKALVIDTTGDMVAKYYRPDLGDVLINPFDKRGVYWDILSECTHEYQFDSISKAIVPQNSGQSDPIWSNGAAKLLSVALQKAKEKNISLMKLFQILVSADLKVFSNFFAKTDAATFGDIKGEKTTMSFRTTLADSVQFLKHLDPINEIFSLSEWIADDSKRNWVFISSNEDQMVTLRPLISALFEVASTSVMTLQPSQTRRIWFIMDELPALQRLKSLSALLSKGRKYGVCLLSGLQSMSQFEKEYGYQDAKTILNLFSTKFFFRSTEINTCDQISRWLGEEEVEESKESLSYGAHQMRDGVSLNHQRLQRKLVLPIEISQLPDLVCYAQYPENFPIAKIKMSYKKIPELNMAFESA